MLLQHDAWLLCGNPADEDVTCPRCRGAGSVHLGEGEEVYECPLCGGVGEVNEGMARKWAKDARRE